jgi:group I intron endonuclease
MTGVIYILKDPETDLVRYVGQTVVLINKRYAQHIYNWKRSKTYVNCWIKSLAVKGLKPVIEIIEDGIPREDLNTRESDYIKLFKALGATLCNLTSGGSGLNNFKPTQESKDKRLESLKTSESWKVRNQRHSQIIRDLHKIKIVGFRKPHSSESKLQIGLSNPQRVLLLIKDLNTGEVCSYNSMREFAYVLGYKSENSVKDFIFNKRNTHLHKRFEVQNKTAAELKKKASATKKKSKK